MTTRLAVSFVLLAALSSCAKKSDLPALYPVPPAALVSDAGKPFRLDQLRGFVTIYDFIFTNCAGTCPLMALSMHNLTHAIPASLPVRFVSISVDPERDTPEALRRYGSKVGRDPRWIFLTGDKQTIIDLSVKGFKLTASTEGTDQPGSESILHSSRFALADRNGVIRAYYDGTSPDAVEKLASDARELAEEK